MVGEEGWDVLEVRVGMFCSCSVLKTGSVRLKHQDPCKTQHFSWQYSRDVQFKLFHTRLKLIISCKLLLYKRPGFITQTMVLKIGNFYVLGLADLFSC